jgi:hypothetical protein
MAMMTMLEVGTLGDLIAFTNLFPVHLCYLPEFSAFRSLWRCEGIEHLRVD